MRIIVCGGRDFTDWRFAYRALELVNDTRPITEVIEGGQRTYGAERRVIGGGDYWGFQWARAHGISQRMEAADWARYGSMAGRIRNNAMLDMRPDAVFAFPGGAGTAHMMRIARKKGVEVIVAKEVVGLSDDIEENWLRCPKCAAISGDDWSQCRGSCPIPGSPHFVA